MTYTKPTLVGMPAIAVVQGSMSKGNSNIDASPNRTAPAYEADE